MSDSERQPPDRILPDEALQEVIDYYTPQKGEFWAHTMAVELMAKRKWVPRLLDTVELYRQEYPGGREAALATEESRRQEFHKRILDERTKRTLNG